MKVEATKYTEVGYYGRDVESLVRDLVEASIALVKAREKEKVASTAGERAEARLLDLLLPAPPTPPRPTGPRPAPTRRPTPRADPGRR